jgi:hypothetical protein
MIIIWRDITIKIVAKYPIIVIFYPFWLKMRLAAKECPRRRALCGGLIKKGQLSNPLSFSETGLV